MIDEIQPRRAVSALGIALIACTVVMMAFGVGKLAGSLDPLLARRGVGAILGLMLVATGNFVPKLRLFEPRSGNADSHSIDRFAGWIFVVCGLAFAVVFLLAPADLVFVVPPLIVVAGFLAVLARWLMWKGKQAPTRPMTAQPGRATARETGRLAIATMLATVLWVSTIFLADSVWGDDIARKMAIAFPILLIVFTAVRAVSRSRAAGV